MSLGDVFLSRENLDELNRPKNRIEPEFEPVFNSWREKRDPDTTDQLLTAITPVIQQNVRTVGGADPLYMGIQGKLLAMRAMEKYDPARSSVATYLNRQLMPLRRTARKQVNILTIPDRVLIAAQQMEGAETELEDELGRAPTTTELADRMHISTKQIERIRRMSHARNTGSLAVPTEEGGSNNPAVRRTLKDEYRHEYVMSALHNDPISQFIYECDNQLNGRRPLPVDKLAQKVGLTAGAVSQRRNKIGQIASGAERAIYG